MFDYKLWTEDENIKPFCSPDYTGIAVYKFRFLTINKDCRTRRTNFNGRCVV